MKRKKKNKPAAAPAAAPAAPADPRVHGMDLVSRYRGAIMGFSALWILFFHLWKNLFTAPSAAAEVEAFLKRIGFCGVDMFLLLSGIGLTYAIGKSSLPQFYYRRIKRIILPFLAMGIVRAVTEHWPMETFWKNITGYNFYASSMYSFLWFVPAVTTLYLLFPLYYRFFLKSKNPTGFLLVSLEVWLILSVYFRDTLRSDLFGFTNRIPVFLVGILFGWLLQNRKPKFTSQTWWLIAATFILGLYMSYMTNYKGYFLLVNTSNCCIPNLLISLSLPFLLAKTLDLLCNGKHTAGGGKVLLRVLNFYGTFSLEFYCVQEWLGGKIIQKLAAQGYSNLAINILVLLNVTLVSFVAHFLFTKFWKLVDMLAAKAAPKKA